MKRTLAILTFALLSTLPALAQDWPGWRGPGRDGKLVGFQPPASWPQELKKGWQVEVGEGHSTPALVGGRLYVHARQGDDEVTFCLEASSGNKLWRNSLAAPYEPAEAAKSYGKGPFSSPTVVGGRVYTFGIAGVVSCLDAKDGTLVWRNDCKEFSKNPCPMWGTALSPLVVDGLCVVHVGRDKEGEVVALDVATGKPKWRWKGDGPSYASPILASPVGKKQIILQTEFKTVGLSPELQPLWELDFHSQYEQNSVTPVITGDQVVLAGWGMGVSSYKLGGAKPEQVWKSTDASMFMSTPVFKGGKLFGFCEKKRGYFVCIDAKTGDVTWEGDPKQGANAALIDAGPVIIALTAPEPTAKGGSSLVVFEANDKEYKELARYKVAETPAFAHPVVFGKSIFVKDKTKLTQWTLP